LELSLVENVQRADLSPLEEAEGYQRLIDEFQHSQEALAKVVGKSRSHIANTLRLLTLPDAVKAMLDDGRVSAGHARALITAAHPEALAEAVVSGNLTVRETEALVRNDGKPGKKGATRGQAEPPMPDADTRAIERSLADRLGLAVRIRHRGPGGRLEINYRDLEQLDDVLRRLGGTE